MNTSRYRIIFNQARGCLMAVAETAARQGKEGKGALGERMCAGVPAWPAPKRLNASLHAVSLAGKLLCRCVLVWLPLACLIPAQAQTVATRIVADPGAPSNQRPTVLNSGNGVVQVDIQTPNGAGVSRNTYNQFDVGPSGAILNNSRTNAQTQLGGWVQANPWLAIGPAQVILNEVNSSNPSLLHGYVEVAGQRAEVVFANPSGISVNGGGFINASQVTLTTGVPFLNNTGALDRYRVQGGNIRIDGQGLDSRNADYTAILTRAMQVNAGIWAQQLQVVTGANDIQAASVAPDTLPQTQALPGIGAAPAFALDVAQLGGMYAGKIHLIGTEAGVGVRTAGLIQANQGPLTLSQSGWLSNSGTLQASGGDVSVQTGGSLDQSGTVYSTGNVQLVSQGDQTHSGTVAALGDVQIQASGSTSQVRAGNTALWGAGLTADGKLTGSQNLSVQAGGQVQLAGQALATHALTLQGSSLDLSNANMQAVTAQLQATQGDLNATGSQLLGTNQLQLQASNALITDQAHVQADTLSLQAGRLSNVAGQIVQTGTADQTVALQGTLDNTAGIIQSAAQNLSFSAQSIDNSAGQLLHMGQGTFALTSQGLLNNTTQTVTRTSVTDGGRIIGLGAMQVQAQDLNNSGTMYAGRSQTVTATHAITHTGVLAAAQDLNISAASLAGNNTSLLAAGMDTNGKFLGAGALSVQTTGALQMAGQAQAFGAVQLSGARLDLSGATTGSTRGDVSLTATSGDLLNVGGRIRSPGQITLTANNQAGQKLDNTQGQINANQLQISVGQLDNTQGRLEQTGTGTSLASIQSTGQINNTQGRIVANAQDVSIVAGGVLTNTDGLIGHAGSGTMSLSADQIDNTRGKVVGNGDIALVGNSNVVNVDGWVSSSRALNMAAGSLDNTRGVVSAGQDLNIASDGQLINDQGELSAMRNLRISAGQAASPSLRMSNTGGLVVADNSISVRAGTLAGAGQIVSQGDIDLSLQGDHTLAGTLKAAGNLQLQATGTLTNPVSVQAGNSLSVIAQNLNNLVSGELLSNQTTSLNVGDTLTNRGLIDGTDTRIQAATLNNLGSGRLYGNRVAVAASTLNNQEETVSGATRAAVIAARERLDMGVQNLTNREQALIHSDGDMAVGGALDANWQATGRAGNVNNNSAVIEAGKSLTIQAANIRNTNEHFATDIKTLQDKVAIIEYQGSGAVNRYQEGTPNVYTYPDESLHLHTPDANYEQWTKFDYFRTVTQSVVTQTAPGRIMAGQGISLVADSVLNDKSQIVAGGALRMEAQTLSNLDGLGTQTTTEEGKATAYWRVGQKGTDTTGSSITDYKPSPVTETIQLNVNQLAANTANAATSTAPTALALSNVQNQANAPGAVSAAGGSSGSNPATGLAQSQTQIRMVLPNTRLPSTSLYRQHPEVGASYLIETDPQYTQYKTWLGSDYMLQALNQDPAVTQKRLGDGYYEQKIVREQVMALTGKRFLDDYTSDQQTYLALMDTGLTYAHQWNLRPGIALSAAQVAQLTSDMVWLVSQEVTLPDGSRQSVLVPQVYLRAKSGDLDGSGTLLAGKDVSLQLSGDLVNSGTVAGRNLVQISANNVRNLNGTVSADQVALQALQDIDNVGGVIQAQSAAALMAGRDIHLTTTTQSSASRVGASSFAQTGIDRVAGLYVSGPAGVLLASAGRDLNLSAAQIQNTGTGGTLLNAGRDIQLGTVTTSNSQNIVWDASNRLTQSSSQDVGSQISSHGNLTLNAGQDVNAKAANVQGDAALNVSAGRNVNLGTGQASQSVDEAHQHTSSGFLSSKTVTTRDQGSTTTALGSNLGGQSVSINAGQDLNVQGSSVLADQDLRLQAAGNVNIEAARNTSNQSAYRQESQSGLMSGGGLSISIGSREQSLAQNGQQTSAAASTVGSIGGNVGITSGKAYTQTGSDVLAPQGNIDISAQTVNIAEARETGSQSTEQKFKQSGVTLSVTSPVVSSLQTAKDQLKAADNTQSTRMKALAAANAAINAAQAADAVIAGQNLTDGNAADKVGGLSVSVSVGSSSSKARQSSSADNARGSNVNAGGNVSIQATGAGQNSDLTVQGSTVKAAGSTTLKADDQVNLLAAQNTTTENSNQSGSSASVGVAIQLGKAGGGMGVTASASKATGQGAGNGTTYTNAHVEGGQQVVIESGGDTTLKGATVTGNQVTAKVGGNLDIESLQDANRYNEKSQSEGASVMIGTGGGGSVNLAQSKIKSDYQSVNEQSAIRAGNGGFKVDVQGDTALKGGQITSTQAAVDSNKNSFKSGGTLITEDLHNAASYDAQSVSVGLATGTPSPGASPSAGFSSAGIGTDGGNTSSTTTAGISGIAGDSQARTGDASTSLKPIFDADKVRKEITAQTAITQEFGKQASKAVGDYADAKLKEAKKLGDQAGIDAWSEGGSARVGLHTVVGGLSGGMQGAVGAATSQTAVPLVGDALRDADIPLELKQALVLAAGTAVGAATGEAAGAATGLNATANNYLYHYNGKIIARDKSDNDKIINLSESDLRKLAAENPEVLNQLIAGIGKTDAPILVKDSSAQNMTSSRIQDLNNPNDRTAIAKETDMGYVNISGQARVFVQTGMDNNQQDASVSAQALSKLLGGVNTGYINNGTEGLAGDVGEYLPNSLSKRDVLNEYTYRTLNDQGSTLIVTHSAGNEDARKALQAGALYGHSYDNLSFVSLGSPVSGGVMNKSVTGAGANYLGQINDWRDPVTYSKTAASISVGGFLGGIGYGAMQGCGVGAGAGWLGCVLGGVAGGVAGGVPGTVGYFGLQNYHPFESYIAKPQSQSIMFDWLKNNPQSK